MNSLELENIKNDYLLRIEDFKKTYDTPISISKIEKYLDYFSTTLKILNSEEIPSRNKLHVLLLSKHIIQNILTLKRKNFSEYRTEGEFEYELDLSLGRDRIEEYNSNQNLSRLLYYLVPADPWKQIKPTTDEQILLHVEWWDSIELRKIKQLINSVKSINTSHKMDETLSADETSSVNENSDVHPNQVFDSLDTKKWYNELIKDEKNIKSNGKPNIKVIVSLLIDMHKKKTGHEPNPYTIRDHRRKHKLMTQ